MHWPLALKEKETNSKPLRTLHSFYTSPSPSASPSPSLTFVPSVPSPSPNQSKKAELRKEKKRKLDELVEQQSMFIASAQAKHEPSYKIDLKTCLGDPSKIFEDTKPYVKEPPKVPSGATKRRLKRKREAAERREKSRQEKEKRNEDDSPFLDLNALIESPEKRKKKVNCKLAFPCFLFRSHFVLI